MSDLNVTMRLENKINLKIKYRSIWSTDSDSENQKDLIAEVLVEEKVVEEYLEWDYHGGRDLTISIYSERFGLFM